MRHLLILVAAAVIVVLTAACAARDQRDADFRHRVTLADDVSVDVRVEVGAEAARQGPRYLRAAIESTRVLGGWFGRDLGASLFVRAGARDAATAASIAVPPVPWWSTRGSMTIELAVARAMSRHAWSSTFDSRALPPSLVDALVEYSARRSVEPIFQSEFQPPGYAMLEPRYFGGFVPASMRIRRTIDEGDAHVRTLVTLERWLSRSTFDGALAAFVRRPKSKPATLQEFERAISAASGQDLSWLFAQTLDGFATFDYAVANLTTSSEASGGFTTAVTVDRRGDGVFAGTSRPRVGAFESGRGVTLLVTFANGSTLRDAWDGRDRTRTFVYRGPSPAQSAVIDPDEVIAVDAARLNNSRTLAPRAATAASRWAARWSLWFQHLLLDSAFFV
jgi:hypothetical protein